MNEIEALCSGSIGPEVIVRDQWRESLHLEFKTLTDLSGKKLTRDDRKIVAKALSGFCNADGGTLILGIETEKQDGLDVASAIKPIEDSERLASLISAALPELLQPQSSSITVMRVAIEGNQGIVVLQVGKSNDRPFMSVPAGQFFRRTFDTRD